MKIFLCQYVVHRNPRFFEEPDVFKPERFEGAADSEMRRFSYFPFGGGTHLCLGQSFADWKYVLIMAVLAQRFRFDLEPNQTVRLNARFALRPQNGIRVKVVAKVSSTGGM